jgi:Protein of unknown function (DUF2971)
MGLVHRSNGTRVAHAGLMEGDLHWLQYQDTDENLLYHYTRPDSLDTILANGTLRLSPYANTNDPREQKDWRPAFVMPATPARPPERWLDVGRTSAASLIDETTDRHLRRGARLACFAHDRERLNDASVGTLFHRGWARARMWHQYASEHTGACLVFDRTELLESVDNRIPHQQGDLFTWGKVAYRDQALTIPLSVPMLADVGVEAALDNLSVRQGAVEHLYLTKNTDWESEQEFRIVVIRWNVGDKSVDEPIDVAFGNALRAVVFGDRFTGDIVAMLADRPDVDALRCRWGDGVPLLASEDQ